MAAGPELHPLFAEILAAHCRGTTPGAGIGPAPTREEQGSAGPCVSAPLPSRESRPIDVVAMFEGLFRVLP